MDYKKVLRLHFVNHLSCREIAESCGDSQQNNGQRVPKAVSERIRSFIPFTGRCQRMKYIGNLLYKKPGVSADQLLYRDFNKEAVYKALARKGETLKHLWQKYNAIGVVDGKKPMSYRQYCRRYSVMG